jgi:1-deoxy-D-xylulose-5-phosphate synthase
VQAGLEALPYGKGEVRRLTTGKPAGAAKGLAILAFGTLLYPALAVADKLNVTVVNMRWAKPLDAELLLKVAAEHEALVTLEEGAVMGGAGSAVSELLQAAGVVKPLLQLGLQDEFIEHGDPIKLLALQGLDAAGIQAAVVKRFAALLESVRPALKVVA